MTQKKLHPLRWVIWSLAAAFYFYEFLIRVSPSVMIQELMQSFNVTATSIGSLAAMYFYIYAPMQLVVGVLTDRYGAKKLLAFAALGTGIGTILFAVAPSFGIAATGRLLIGAGSSFGFIGMVYVCSHWFPIQKRGILIGLANGIGMLGAVSGEGPLRIGLNALGWRTTMAIMGLVGLFLAALIYFLVRKEPVGFKRHKGHPHPLWENFVVVISNPLTWLNAVSSACAYFVAPAFGALWGIPFLVANYGISVELAGFAVSMIFIGWAVGGPIVGRFADKMRVKKPILVSCYFVAGMLMSWVVFIHSIPLILLHIILFLVGFFTSAQLLNYSYSIDINPESAKGTASSFTNFVIISFAALSQPLLGIILDSRWIGKMSDGARIYPAEAYMWACATIPIAFFLAFFLSLFLKNVKVKVS